VTWWQATVLGLVEGITEYLPVSSTGHLILARALIASRDPAHEVAMNAFLIVVQGGAILAVLGLYWPRVVQMLRGLAGRDRDGLRLSVNLLVAFLPAAIAGVMLGKLIERSLFGIVPVLAALAVGGVYMIVIDRWAKRKRPAGLDVSDLTPGKALFVGALQCVAMWPGTSRSMMAITGGYLVGLTPVAAAEFSFLLGLPTLGAATTYTLVKTPDLFGQLGPSAVAIGLIAATVSAAVAVKWLVGFLQRHGLSVFGVYRIALCVALGALVAAGVVGRH
jgi:undecaprenyl-diphosphatase